MSDCKLPQNLEGLMSSLANVTFDEVQAGFMQFNSWIPEHPECPAGSLYKAWGDKFLSLSESGMAEIAYNQAVAQGLSSQKDYEALAGYFFQDGNAEKARFVRDLGRWKFTFSSRTEKTASSFPEGKYNIATLPQDLEAASKDLDQSIRRRVALLLLSGRYYSGVSTYPDQFILDPYVIAAWQSNPKNFLEGMEDSFEIAGGEFDPLYARRDKNTILAFYKLLNLTVARNPDENIHLDQKAFEDFVSSCRRQEDPPLYAGVSRGVTLYLRFILLTRSKVTPSPVQLEFMRAELKADNSPVEDVLRMQKKSQKK